MTNTSQPIRSFLLAGAAGIATAAMLVPVSPAQADATAPCNTNGTGGSQSVECRIGATANGSSGATAVGGDRTW
ncbi:MAG: hypothetical protein P8J20_08385 [Novosphingobium sp.]|nr:hypothetical protein [Novosphingobium sp.]